MAIHLLKIRRRSRFGLLISSWCLGLWLWIRMKMMGVIIYLRRVREGRVRSRIQMKARKIKKEKIWKTTMSTMTVSYNFRCSNRSKMAFRWEISFRMRQNNNHHIQINMALPKSCCRISWIQPFKRSKRIMSLMIRMIWWTICLMSISLRISSGFLIWLRRLSVLFKAISIMIDGRRLRRIPWSAHRLLISISNRILWKNGCRNSWASRIRKCMRSRFLMTRRSSRRT